MGVAMTNVGVAVAGSGVSAASVGTGRGVLTGATGVGAAVHAMTSASNSIILRRNIRSSGDRLRLRRQSITVGERQPMMLRYYISIPPRTGNDDRPAATAGEAAVRRVRTRRGGNHDHVAFL